VIRHARLALYLCLAPLIALPVAGRGEPVRIRDINTATDFTGGTKPSSPQFITALDSATFVFFADDGVHGRELWRSDGTEVGTVLVKDIVPGSGQPAVSSAVRLANRVVFHAATPSSGGELWVTDGSAAGTFLLRDIAPGTASSFPGNFTELDGRLYFTATSDATGWELWVTDGTVEGTMLVKDIAPGPTSSDANRLTVLGNAIYFFANDSLGRNLWKSDGTSVGTVKVGSILPTLQGISPLVPYEGHLYFNEDGNLWRTDGTSQGTRPVTNPDGSFIPSGETFAGSRLFIKSVSATGSVTLRVLEPDGSVSLLADIAAPCLANCGTAQPSDVVIDGKLFFTVQNRELWASDGTSQGTRKVSLPIWVSGGHSNYNDNPIRWLTAVGNRLYLSILDSEKFSYVLWQVEGSDLRAVRTAYFCNPSQPVKMGSLLVLAGATSCPMLEVSGDFELWKVDLSAAQYQVAQSSIDFSEQSQRTTSRPKTVAIVNYGDLPITVQPTKVTGPFAVSTTCELVPATSNCELAVTFTPPAPTPQQGRLNLLVSPSSTTHEISLSGEGAKTLVTHFYSSILGRVADEGGKAFWDGEADRAVSIGIDLNETWFSMAMSFYSSPEYISFGRNQTEFISDLYRTFFNRQPDGDGLTYWTGQLYAGMPRQVALTSFMLSPEFQQFTREIYGDTSVRAEANTVVDFFRGLLSRLPDSSGYAYWLQRFRDAQCKGSPDVIAEVESISKAFLNGSEYQARQRNDEDFIGDLYNTFLRRGGDLAGVNYWLSQLRAGLKTRDQLRRDFIASPEFSSRVQRILSEGCLMQPNLIAPRYPL
jgi:ELWxxDGT repeat protein